MSAEQEHAQEARELRAELERVKAQLDEERLESAAWRAKARDKGESARKMREQRDRLVEALSDTVRLELGETYMGSTPEQAENMRRVRAVLKEVSGE